MVFTGRPSAIEAAPARGVPPLWRTGRRLCASRPVTWCGTDEVTDNHVPGSSSRRRSRCASCTPSPDGVGGFDARRHRTDAAWIGEWCARRIARARARPLSVSRLHVAGRVARHRLRAAAATPCYRSPAARAPERRSAAPHATRRRSSLRRRRVGADVCGQSLSNEAGGSRRLLRLPPVGLRSHAARRGRAPRSPPRAIHNFGALPFGAPNPCPRDGGHPCDSTTHPVPAQTRLDPRRHDARLNHDDYYAPGSWWDARTPCG
jgi:hypothetical protein